MDALLVSTEEDGDGYFTCEQLTDLVLERAIRLLGRNRDFHYLPAASLTVRAPMVPTSRAEPSLIEEMKTEGKGRARDRRIRIARMAIRNY